MVTAKKKATTKKTSSKKITDEEKWGIGELLLTIDNDRPLYWHFYSNWYNTYAKRKAKPTWDREKAIKGLAGAFCTQALSYYNHKYGEYDTIRLSKEAKLDFGRKALAKLYEHGLKNIKTGSKPRMKENPTIGTNDNYWYVVSKWRK